MDRSRTNTAKPFKGLKYINVFNNAAIYPTNSLLPVQIQIKTAKKSDGERIKNSFRNVLFAEPVAFYFFLNVKYNEKIKKQTKKT